MNKGKYPSFRSYIKGIFKSSLITSFPEIATTKSITKRLVKSMVFVVCTIGFTYQTLDFLKMYLAYPTVVNVQITNPYMVDQPGITVCNSNRRRRTLVCTAESNDCTTIEPKIFCETHAIQCPRRKARIAFTSVPNENMTENEFNWKITKEEAHNDSMFLSCIKTYEGGKNMPCNKPYMPVPVILTNGEPNYCYTIDSQYGKPDAQPNRYPNFFTMEVQLSTEPDQYLMSTRPIRMQLALHDRKSRINPFIEGYPLKAGIQYIAYVSMVSKNRLPYPYDTNCTDYLKEWRENNGTGPLNEIMCVDQCKLNKLLKRGLCIDKTVNYPHEEQLCPQNKIIMTEEILEECYSECGYACSDNTYEVQFEEIDNYDYTCKTDDLHCKNKRIRTVFNFLKFRRTDYIYEPKFENIEMFSYVGGYMGMWLGLSLISLFDLFETLVYMLYYPVGREAHRRQKIMKFGITGRKRHDTKYYSNPTVLY